MFRGAQRTSIAKVTGKRIKREELHTHTHIFIITQ